MRAAEWCGGRVPVEDLNDARTKHGERRVSARRGLAGEKSGFSVSCPNDKQAVRRSADGLSGIPNYDTN